MRKRLGILWIAFCMAFALAGVPDEVWAASGKVSVSVSAGNVNIGDTVTVSVSNTDEAGGKAVATVTLSYDANILQFVSCSTTSGGGGGSVIATGDTFTVSLQAIAAGTSAISASGTDGVSFSSNEELESMAGGSASVTVNNAAAAGGGGAVGTGGAGDAGGATGSAGQNLSADNSLKSLTISPGTLSPAFSGRTTQYSATVAGDVTSIAVTAVPANSKAVVESVTGSNDLKVGSNAVRIVVRAENGVTATYTVNVTRQSGTDAPTSASETSEKPEEPDDGENIVSVNGVSHRISEKFAAEDIPKDFAEASVTYHGTEYKGVSFDKGSVKLLWMEREGAEGSFFVFDELRDAVYPFVRLGSDERYVIALLAPVDFAAPEGYLQTSLPITGEKTITAYQEEAAGSETASDFYRFYGVNHDGVEGWYQYDAKEGTYQRSSVPELKQETTIVEDETFDAGAELAAMEKEYAELSDQYSRERVFARNTIALLVFLLAVLILVIVNLLIARFRKGGDEIEADTPSKKEASAGSGTPERSKREKPKPEESKPEKPKREKPKREEPKREEPKQEEPKKKEKGSLDVIDFNDL